MREKGKHVNMENLIDAILNIEVTQSDGQKIDLEELLIQHTLSAILGQLGEPTGADREEEDK